MLREMVFVAALATVLPAQTPEFDVATVKVASPNGDRGTNINTDGDTITLHNATLKFAIQAAYSVPAERISGGPDWAGTQRFEITGKSAAPVPPPQLLQMLRTLLAERFKLKLHSEAREVSVYALVQAKSGAKLQRSDANDGIQPSILGQPGRGGIVGKKATMPQLAATLSIGVTLGRPVLDKTGLAGAYDFNLDGFAPLTAGPDDPRPSLFTVLEEKLGLRLESTKATLEALVIDSAAKPSEN